MAQDMAVRFADTIRALTVDAVETARSGHPGLPLGCAEIGAVLFLEVLRHDPTWPDWPDRDRFVLSAGHGSMLLYALLHLTGYSLPLEELRRFRQLDSMTPGHPEWRCAPGVETTTGPLGQGLANAVGMALAERLLAARFNRPGFEVVNHRTWVLASDGDLMEGVSGEAVSLAGHLGLGRLCVVYDANQVTIEGSTELAFREDVGRRFEACGWRVTQVDGHDVDQLRRAFRWACQEDGRPALIIARTHLAAKSPKQDQAEAHGAPLGQAAQAALKEAIGWPAERWFFVPDEVRRDVQQRMPRWQQASQRWRQLFQGWSEAFPHLRAQWDAAMAGQLPAELESPEAPVESWAGPLDRPVATRVASGRVLQELATRVLYLVGGSADLAPSTRTYLEGWGSVGPGRFEGRNLHFGVREHAMGAVLNGMALHGGLRVFGGTFLVFSDYMRPAIRLAAMMGLPVIYVFTHDSIYVGEDGPTHQPVEQLESLRIIPGLEVWRPADAAETALAWAEAMRRREGPTALVLTRQEVPPVVPEGDDGPERRRQGLSEAGAYVVQGVGEVDVTLVASGSEVSLAVQAARELAGQGVRARVVSVACRERLLRWEPERRERLLGGGVPRVFVEAGEGSGWGWLARPGDGLVAVRRFGLSGPGAQVARRLGLTPERVVQTAREALERQRAPAPAG